MKQISETVVGEWRFANNFTYPSRITIRCGHCKAVVVFSLIGGGRSSNSLSWTEDASCPNCKEFTEFFAIGRSSEGPPEGKKLEALYAFPDPAEEREPVFGLEYAPVELREAYMDALATLNSGAPVSAVLNQCRQALEAFALAAIPEDKRPKRLVLADLLRTLPESADLGAPILGVADALRNAGNIGSHWSPGRKLTPEMGTQMMDLLDAMLEYLFVIPKQVEQVGERIATIRAPAAAPDVSE